MLTRRALTQAGPLLLLGRKTLTAAERPNIVWLTGEDMGPQLSCYGHPLVRTPNIDRLAREGVRFTRAFTTAPVCSPSRSAFNTGMYQTAIGAHHHRSHRADGYRLPAGVRLASDHLRELGYFTANVTEIAPGVRGMAKTDFNFTADKPYDGTHWRQRKAGQPFFAHVNYQAPHKGPAFKEARRQASLIDPRTVELPPYYPDHPVVRDEVANFLDAIHLLDQKVGVTLAELEKDGLLENTLVVFFGDNGRCLIRGKQWLYDAGLHIPLIARWPGRLTAGSVRAELVSAIDLLPTALEAAGGAVPKAMHGRPLWGRNAKPRDMVFAARDRCDVTVDRIRCARDTRFKLIRNLMPEKPYTQWNRYIETEYPTLRVMQELHRDGKLNATQRLFMAERKPDWELYDTVADPHEVNNLVGRPEHRATQARLGGRMERWMAEIGDQGLSEEAESSRAGSQD